MAQGKKVFIYSHGCEMRGLDARKLGNYFRANGCLLVTEINKAELIVFISCAYLKTTADFSLDIVRELEKSKAEIIVAGCLPDIRGQDLQQIYHGKILPTKHLEKIDELFPDNPVKFADVPEGNFAWVNPFGASSRPGEFLLRSSLIRRIHLLFENTVLDKFLGNIYPFFYLYEPDRRRFQNPSMFQITISRGCNHHCTYCSITKAVGPLHSKPLDTCLAEFKNGRAQGHTTFILQADDIGTYGSDIHSSLPALLDRLTTEPGEYNIILRNTHPLWVHRYLDELSTILTRGKITELLLSVQSGNNEILEAMRRGYTRDDIIHISRHLKTAYPPLKIGLEIIIGFPGETPTAFNDTITMIDAIHPDNGMIASFSPNIDTPAYQMEPKTPEKTIRKRMTILKKHLRTHHYFAWYNTSYCKGIFFKDKEQTHHEPKP